MTYTSDRILEKMTLIKVKMKKILREKEKNL